MTTIKRRPRRIAADEAHAWARNLRLGNHHAKMVLSMLTLYVNGEGEAFVGIPSLAEDCELSPDTVRKRLAWLETIGAIARVPQWLDENGNRNSLGRGRRTTDLVKLLLENDQADVEARAAGNEPETPAKSTEISPSWQQGLNGLSPRLGLGLDSVDPGATDEGLISEPEPKPDSPIAPKGGEGDAISILSDEPEHFAPAFKAWPGHEIMRRDLALAEFKKLDPADQLLCRAAIPQFLKMREQMKRTLPPGNFHIWIRTGGFREFPNATLEQAASGTSTTSFDETSREGRAIKALYAFARTSLFINRGSVIYPLPVTAQVLAFAEAPDQAAWQWVTDRGQIAAWSTFLSAHVHRSRPDPVITRPDGSRGMMAPWPWPPRKDGGISEQHGEVA